MSDKKSTNKSKELLEKTVKDFSSNKVSGIITVLDGDKFHFNFVGIGPGRALDLVSSMKASLLEIAKSMDKH